MSIKSSAAITPLDPVGPCPIFEGNLVDSVTETVEAAEVRNGLKRPTIIHKPDGRNYFRLTELPAQAEIHCSTVDCDNQAKLLLDSRDAEVLPYCRACAHVEFAMWMVGV
ncbi:MAG: hypothetical protein JWO19_4382 [Bryobacterales bacterium]|nr:hypothetical protein [Bryobacterales bacterium]